MNWRKRKKLSRRLAGAALTGDVSRVRAALRAGAPAETADSAGSTPLYLASVGGETGIVRLLLAAGARPDTESGMGSEGTPLCGAACWGHTETVRVLLEHGADPNLREDHGTGWSPLQWASNGPHQETADLLLAAGARRCPGTDRRRQPRRGEQQEDDTERAFADSCP
ncbi:ankyrin repeat domain-containing protein [Streptomyces sp. NRRL F-7442]|uniref:ankyrin repeat domain-containing protein n=1 Tax=Streptomyces sp. NRRL F-7442 TaxID=1519498 RepID=UPI00099CDF6C|nr:ankyrin repeat domain-containing protein [Streptomyces sp. NRRL F-7442]